MQPEADQKLADAILEHAKAYGNVKDGEFLGDWAVIAAWSTLELTGDTTYTTSFSAPEIPTHIAVGLFQVGINLTLEEDEEEL